MATIRAYTTIEQSKKLLKLGLSIESADMFYQNDGYGTFFQSPDVKENAAIRNIDLPCWSVGALIEVMPQSVIDKDGISFGLNINHDFVEYYNSSMGALYATYHSISAETTLDACYDMVVWLLENGYIKKGE